MASGRLLALLLEYDGARYAGWQRQAGALSVQAAVEEAIRRITGRRAAVVGSGRTDAKAHAAGQVAHFRTASRLPLGKWVGALNANLPSDVSVLEAWEPPAGFHAQFSAVGKVYAYRIWNARGRSALLHDRAWHIPVPLDVPAMRRAARRLVGRHDFRAFAQTEGANARASTVRRIRSIRILRQGRLVTIEVAGDGFLTHMVRILAGTLAEVGKGRRSPASVAAALEGKRRAAAGPTAPARGLTLLSVSYLPRWTADAGFASSSRPSSSGSVTGARQAPPEQT